MASKSRKGRNIHRSIDAEEMLLRDLEQELAWFTRYLDARFDHYFDLQPEGPPRNPEDLPLPDLRGSDSTYAQLVREHAFGRDERVALALCLTTYLRPQLLDVFFTKNETFDRPFTEFGGVANDLYGAFAPTAETLLFLLGGRDLYARGRAMRLLEPEHPLFRRRILELGPPPAQGSLSKRVLQLSPERHAQLIRRTVFRPEFGAHFPARRITTELDWSDLVLHPHTRGQLEEIRIWAKHGTTLLEDWGMAKKLRPGYRSLFYGPPGTGKTMTASLLGKTTGRDVYLVDLSMVISKYIGETEKNLAKVFDQAEYRNWILFFDEADALFGKRTQIQNAHDRYANQEVSYLLQRIELFDGITILASNLRSNLDEAFTRRFESIIHFPLPGAEERLRLWQQGFSPKAVLHHDVDLPRIARQYELSGGAIMNVIRYASLRALDNGGVIRIGDLLEGVRREYAKEGRSV